jgi:uncharacterized Zn finger protein
MRPIGLHNRRTQWFMSDPDTILGACPSCEHDLRRVHVLIDYETDSGEPGVWADCPECGEVVDPTN